MFDNWAENILRDIVDYGYQLKIWSLRTFSDIQVAIACPELDIHVQAPGLVKSTIFLAYQIERKHKDNENFNATPLWHYLKSNLAALERRKIVLWTGFNVGQMDRILGSDDIHYQALRRPGYALQCVLNGNWCPVPIFSWVIRREDNSIGVVQ